MLGGLEGKQFKFKEGVDGWGQFSDGYVRKLLAIARAKSTLNEVQRWRSKWGIGAIDDRRTTAQKEVDRKAATGMARFMANSRLPATAQKTVPARSGIAAKPG